MTSRLAALSATAAILASLTACGSSSASGTPPPDRHQTGGHLTPSIPSIFTSGSNACGDPYAFNATSLRRTVPLLNCPGQAGAEPLPTLTIKTGQQILISGIGTRYRVTVTPSGLLTRQGETYLATGSGHVRLAIHHYPFCDVPSGPATCPLLDVTITRQ